MKPLPSLLTALLMLGALSACSPAEPEQPREEHKALQKAIQEPLDKARAVEGELQKQSDAMRKTLEDSEN